MTLRVPERDTDQLQRFFTRDGDPLTGTLGSNAEGVIVNGFTCTRHGRAEHICNPPELEARGLPLTWPDCRKQFEKHMQWVNSCKACGGTHQRGDDLKPACVAAMDTVPSDRSPGAVSRIMDTHTGRLHFGHSTARSHASREETKGRLANCTGPQRRMLRAALVVDPEMSLPDAFALTIATPTTIAESPKKGRKEGRNKKCPCGSGVKMKKCCGREEEQRATIERPKGPEFRGAFLESPAVRAAFQRWIGLEVLDGMEGTVGKYSRELRRWLIALADLVTATATLQIAVGEETTRLTQAEAEEELLRLVGEVEGELAAAFRAAGIDADISAAPHTVGITELAKALRCDPRTLKADLQDRDIRPVRQGKTLVVTRRALRLRYPRAAQAIAA